MSVDSRFRPFLEKHFSSVTPLLCALSKEQTTRFWESIQARSFSEWERLVNAFFPSPTTENLHATWEEPLCYSLERFAEQGISADSLQKIGEEAFQKGEVAFVTVAGGLGTRLGFPGPKGLVLVTPVQQKSLFQVFSEKLQALQKRYHRPFHWLIMTSQQTDAATREAFQQNHWYDPHFLHFFQQGTLPAFSLQKELCIQEDGSLAEFPDGHGGIFQALQKANLLSFLQQNSVHTLSYFQVDNPLVHLDDALFLGAHLQQHSDFSTKVVAKVRPEERVGLFVQHDHRLQLVEYSEFPTEFSSIRNADGALRYRWGNTAIHLLSIDFVKKCVDQPLPYHLCKKKISVFDVSSQEVQSLEGQKVEQFIFDALPKANHPLLWEVQREEEFSPVKNATGTDTLITCQQDQIQRWLRWLQAIDPDFLAQQTQSFSLQFEISPLFADNFRDFSTAWKKLAKKPNTLQKWYAHENRPKNTPQNPRKN